MTGAPKGWEVLLELDEVNTYVRRSKVFSVRKKGVMKYSHTTKDIALASMFLSITIIASLISGSYVPKIPFLNSRIDFWYGIAIAGIFFLKNRLIAISYVFSIIFGLMIFELPAYAGIGDYFIETGIPVIWISLFYCINKKINGTAKNISILIYLVIWSLIRWFFISLGGNIFWGINFNVSLVVNFKNILFDFIAIAIIIVPIISLKKHIPL